MYIAIEGCSHGELDTIYDTIKSCEEKEHLKVDLLICCGDFQSVRNIDDLRCMAVPTKYMNMQSFYKYYSGEAIAPVLTLFIGGNHEASNYLQELPYGGWVAPNIYYLGYGGVINVGGLRIGGVSGIYKGHDYLKGRFECPPYTDNTVRSVYHVRNLDVFRAKQLSSTKLKPVDIFLSHDWPRGVTNFGDAETLCRKKKFFREEVQSNNLGSRAAEEMLGEIRPRYWFSAHLHVKFAALVEHEKTDKDSLSFTKFLALDKCLGKRDYLQIIDIKPNHQSVLNDEENGQKIKITNKFIVDMYNKDGTLKMYHDLEWLTILRLTNHLTKITQHYVYMPGPSSSEEERFNFNPTEEELEETLKMMDNNLYLSPDSFNMTAEKFNPAQDMAKLRNMDYIPYPEAIINPYTVELCEKLGLDDPVFNLKFKGKNKSKSIMSTPKRNPTVSEMNVTLDPTLSQSFVDSPRVAPLDVSEGDIVFEISINSDEKGESVGVLSPAIDKRTRKRLMLSKPMAVLPETTELQNTSSNVASDEIKQLSTDETPKLPDDNKSVTDTASDSSPSVILESSDTSSNMELDDSTHNSEIPNVLPDPSSKMAPEIGDDTVKEDEMSPKRSISAVSADAADTEVKHKKICKIRRRNQALYSEDKEEESIG